MDIVVHKRHSLSAKCNVTHNLFNCPCRVWCTCCSYPIQTVSLESVCCTQCAVSVPVCISFLTGRGKFTAAYPDMQDQSKTKQVWAYSNQSSEAALPSQQPKKQCSSKYLLDVAQ